jgi:pimeloyl-ACP methyl ester carboxylesterase
MNIRGININYYDRGSGEAVLFLHGWGSDISVFRAFLDGLAGYCRALAVDLPGFGGSGEPPSSWSVGDYADFAADFLSELEIKKVVLIGHSFGGRVIIKLASGENSRRERIDIEKIILIDSAGIRPKKGPIRKMRSVIYKAVKALVSAKAVREKFPELLESWRTRNSSADYRNATPMMRECLVKIVGEDLTQCLPSISCPTLLVWGENDRDTPISDARTMERLIPDSGLVILKNAGHYPFLDQSYAFGRVLDSFLNIKRNAI